MKDSGLEEIANLMEDSLNKLKDSGKEYTNFDSGSVRDTNEGKPRYDLIPTYPLRRLAMHYYNGMEKYGERNWEAGQPLMRYIESAFRHFEDMRAGKIDEDHASAVLWNIMGYMATEQWIKDGVLEESFDDRPNYMKERK